MGSNNGDRFSVRVTGVVLVRSDVGEKGVIGDTTRYKVDPLHTAGTISFYDTPGSFTNRSMRRTAKVVRNQRP